MTRQAESRQSRSAMKARGWAMIAAPTLAGILAIVGTVADPLPPVSGRELIEAYTNNPEPLNFKSVAYHYSYTLWMAVVFPLVGLVRGRGSWLANIAGAERWRCSAISTIPGALLADFIQSAEGQVAGVDAAVRISEVVESFWGFAAIMAPGGPAFVLALPLAAIAAWRAGILAWWGALAAVAGVAAFMGGGAMLVGNSILAAAFFILSLALARMTSRRERP
jgi:hypothetical protein